MKKINTIIFISLLVLCWFVWRGFQPDLINTTSNDQNVETIIETEESIKSVENVEKSVFIPYWNIPKIESEIEEIKEYDKVIYFGVAPDKNGDLIDDTGLQNIDKFKDAVGNSQDKLLTIRMLDVDANLAIIEDDLAQNNLATNVKKIISDYDFDGVVLDFELSVLPTASVSSQIASFVKDFSDNLHIGIVPKRDYPYTIGSKVFLALYGDTFYRSRPYDVERLAKYLDGIYIMAYDFHKSRGEPGPNYPFDSGSTNEPSLRASPSIKYNYTFKQMIKDFSAKVPTGNITIIFGMYGYDWTLGPQGLPLKAAVAVSLNEIDTSGANVDPQSKEKNIKYTDDEGYDHILWYEDMESSDVKIEYLKSQGIGSVGYWVWGYY